MAKLRLPNPALVVAALALLVALGGTAVAATPIVTARAAREQRAQAPGQAAGGGRPAGGRRGREAARPREHGRGSRDAEVHGASLAASAEGEFAASCDAGQKVVSGGFSTSGPVLAFDSRPTSETTWSIYLANLSSTTAANVSVYAVCLG